MSGTKPVEGTHYEGPASSFDDSRFINYTTLCGLGDKTVTISEVIGLSPDFKFENGRKLGKKMLCLRFKETPKVLRLNTGNRRRVQRLHGGVTKDWVDQKITLFGDPTVRFGGKEVGGVVVREKTTK